ncbi:MAG: YdeI/OmpD-associated family protein [Gemmatimonadaceae bacterium]
MGTRDPRIDAIIAKSADFAKPILTHIREAVHAGCPDVVETIKWGMPAFEHKGPMCQMAAFKQHCVFGFWKGKLVLAGDYRGEEAMGNFGRIESLKDLPPKRTLVALVKKAAALNDAGVKVPRTKKQPKPALATPPDLAAGLKKNRKAATTFEAFSPSQKREYIEWITEAKTDATREKRLATALEWLAEGKTRNWKYQRA